MFNGVDIRSESRFDELDTKFWQYQFQWDQEVTDRLRFTWLAGRSTSEFGNPVQTTTTLDAPNVNGYTIDFRNEPRPADDHLSVRSDQHERAADHHRHAARRDAGATSRPRKSASARKARTTSSPPSAATWPGISCPTGSPSRPAASTANMISSTFEFRRVNQNDTILALPAGTTLASVTTMLTGFGRGLGLGRHADQLADPEPRRDRRSSTTSIATACSPAPPAGPGDFTLSSITNGNARGNNRAVREQDTGAYAQVDFRASCSAGRCAAMSACATSGPMCAPPAIRRSAAAR